MELNNNIIVYSGLKMLSGINTHPGDGPAANHANEHQIFLRVLDHIKNTENPVMVELGCFWALWSLVFRQRFSGGKNILVELGKRQLSVGEKNFQLNDFSFSSYFGGFFLENSGTFNNRKNDIEYQQTPNSYWDDSIVGETVGKELDFSHIIKTEKLKTIDLLHMDIQGSELPLIEYLHRNKIFGIIQNIVVATHNQKIHDSVLSLLQQNDFIIYENHPYGRVGGDGFLCATKKD